MVQHNWSLKSRSLVPGLQTDHTATLIEIHAAKYTPVPPTMRFNLKTANWTLFKNILDSTDYSTIRLGEDIDIKTKKPSDTLLTAAENSIKKFSDQMPISSLKKSNKIWWSQDCRSAVLSKKKARNIFQRHLSQETFVALSKAKALGRKTVLKAKHSAWNDFSFKIDRSVLSS